jgi:hypothetical protein
MMLKRSLVVLAGVPATLLALLAAAPPLAAQANKACGLLTAAEIESALAAKPSAFREGAGTGAVSKADAQLCTAETPTATVLLRWAKKSGPTSDNAAKGVAMAKQMGAQVEVKTFGPITCSSLIPPKTLEQYGFNTTCSVDKGNEIAAVEVTAKTQKGMVSIENLHLLAEKLKNRF